MSFDKHYPNRKDWRAPYRKSKRFDRNCRNHGAYSYCRNNRLHKFHAFDEDWDDLTPVVLDPSETPLFDEECEFYVVKLERRIEDPNVVITPVKWDEKMEQWVELDKEKK